jgi:hypothetical protein
MSSSVVVCLMDVLQHNIIVVVVVAVAAVAAVVVVVDVGSGRAPRRA